MRTLLALTGFGVCLLLSARSAPLPPLTKAAIILNVKQEQITSSGTNWRDQWGSFSTVYANQRVLIVRVGKVGPFDPNVVLRWYFIGRDETGRRMIYDGGARAAVIKPGGSEILLASKTISETKTRENTAPTTAMGTYYDFYGNTGTLTVTMPGATGGVRKTGTRPVGWCLFGRAQD